jgi:iron complex transport system substrate-binding protein
MEQETSRNSPYMQSVSSLISLKDRFIVLTLSLLISLAFSLLLPWPLAADEKSGVKIISLYAADTEILLRLGARDNIVGISRQETYDGVETQGWERPPAFSIHDDVEKFISIAPDYILLRPQHLATNPSLFETLEKSGIKLWTKQCTKAAELFDFWRELSAIVGRQAQAEAMIEEFKSTLSNYPPLREDQKPGVFLESIHKEVKTFTPESIPIWLMTLAGGRNVASDAQPTRPGLIVAAYGPEKLLEKADQVDVFISQLGPMNPVNLTDIKDREIYRILPAFKNDRVYRVPEELISRPTPSLLEGLALMADQIAAQKP